LISGCYMTNKSILYHSYLANCDNFKEAFTLEEVKEILSRLVLKDMQNNT
ncbi:6993_t:CDS:1, partial [Racocetra fulgida]